MILGTFTWRGMEIEADRLRSKTAGETVWLNRVDTGSATGFGILRNNRLHLTSHAPKDELATIQLRAAYDEFRAAIAGSTP
jgi:hypothetical protein